MRVARVPDERGLRAMLNRIDLRASAKARLVESLSQDAQPGECETFNASVEDGGGVGGLLFVCPGCRALGKLPTKGRVTWTVVEGDVSQPESLTLSPSILHDNPDRGGRCGWHGYLTKGVFVPC